jgi:antitoxin CcdA
LTLKPKVPDVAREPGKDATQTADAPLQEEVQRRHREKWRADNKQAIEVYNARVKRDGVFGNDVRGF